jgi:hypothetical protein
MKRNTAVRSALCLAAVMLLTVGAITLRGADKPAETGFGAKAAAGGGRVFELRTYHAAPGKLEALHARFRDHTDALFKKHGMESVGYWTPREGQPGAGNTLIYILSFPNKEAADASWKAFRTDPDWIKVRDESERNGKLVEKVDSVFMDPTDYSAIK